jgi:hypothetical protein
MSNFKYLQDPAFAPASCDEANGTYRIDEGVLVDPADGIKPSTHIFHEEQSVADRTFYLRTGPTPAGYPTPDTSVRVRHTQPKRSTA